jgi:hypothetical protein
MESLSAVSHAERSRFPVSVARAVGSVNRHHLTCQFVRGHRVLSATRVLSARILSGSDVARAGGPAGAVPAVIADLHGACRARPGARGSGGAATEGHKTTARPAVQDDRTCSV